MKNEITQINKLDLGEIREKMIINNYSKLLRNDNESKKIFMGILNEHVLPFWENAASEIIVGGETCIFNVYLID